MRTQSQERYFEWIMGYFINSYNVDASEYFLMNSFNKWWHKETIYQNVFAWLSLMLCNGFKYFSFSYERSDFLPRVKTAIDGCIDGELCAQKVGKYVDTRKFWLAKKNINWLIEIA